MAEPGSEKPWLQLLRAVRGVILLLIIMNLNLFVTCVYVAIALLQSNYPAEVVGFVTLLASTAFVRVIWLISAGFIQARTASVMSTKKPLEDSMEANYDHDSIEFDQRKQRWYMLWLWWNRLGTVVLISQLLGAWLLIGINDKKQHSGANQQVQISLSILPVATVVVIIFNWFTGSDVMSWCSLYKTNDAWRAYYIEAFRCHIREALCCLGRRCYLEQEQNDEVSAVAKLLGGIVTYRAKGCSHLEVLAGVSMLRDAKQQSLRSEMHVPALEDRIREASVLHPYAVAAYTGPLLDVGRYPFRWLLMWLFSQGVCSFWKRGSRPGVLEGDNWWRGHAATFLRHSRLPSEPDGRLVKGRVLQTKRESAYFVVVLNKLRIVLVAVRGTETPEDLLTDGLSKVSKLADSDLLGLLKGPDISEELRQKVNKGSHYAHSGIIEAARELSMQLDNLAEVDDDVMAASDFASIGCSTDRFSGSEGPKGDAQQGLLSRLLGPGGDCEGYDLRIVGHSLGGAIGALTGLRLYKRYPNLHVYAFGVLPCVDIDIAEACQEFITSVVCHDEFASRLSVASITRLRTNALGALLEATKPGVEKSAGGQRLFVSNVNMSSESCSCLSHSCSLGSSNNGERAPRAGLPSPHQDSDYSALTCTQRLPFMVKGGAFLCAHSCLCALKMSQHYRTVPLSGEVERYEKSLSTQRNSPNISLSSEDDSHKERLLTRLIPPDPIGIDKRPSVAIETQLHERWSQKDDASSESKHAIVRQRESIEPTEMGPGFPNVAADDTLEKEYRPEMLLPGKVIHLVRDEKSSLSWRSSIWNLWSSKDLSSYRALDANRLEFQDLTISPSMFTDHMPWKSQHALNWIVTNRLNRSKLDLPTIS